jgi:hypothetical protein
MSCRRTYSEEKGTDVTRGFALKYISYLRVANGMELNGRFLAR